MITKKSPGGSNFPYYYKNGELFGLPSGSFGSDEERVIERMKAEEKFFLGQNRRIGLWIDFHQTRLSQKVIAEFMGSISRMGANIKKLALVGCSFTARWNLKRQIKNRLSMPIKFFDDPEEAKRWLVAEEG
jgi:hypothetical protein